MGEEDVRGQLFSAIHAAPNEQARREAEEVYWAWLESHGHAAHAENLRSLSELRQLQIQLQRARTS